MSCNMRVTKSRAGMLTYRYDANRDMSFEFHMLCEVGAPFQTEAEAILKKKGWDKIEQKEVPGPIHYADFVVAPTSRRPHETHHV